MKNIMKSIGYEVLHSKMLVRLYILFVALMVLTTMLNTDSSGVSAMLAGNDGTSYEFPMLIVAIIVGVICGSDFNDKVANYEILSGHSRKTVFFARALMAVCISSVLATVLCFVPIIVGSAIFGWGNKLVFSDLIIRNLLLIFPFARLTAFLVVVTFIVKNPYVIMASGFVIMLGGGILGDLVGDGKNCFISIYNMKYLCSYEGWNTYNLDPVKGVVEYYAYNSTVTSSLVLGTVFASIIMIIFYLFMGYALFRRDELN
ncbi:MAG: hypothetical protein E7271_07050 [Lachnospiraceae bacterium]|nr:hypothetical protein [Lachnospiraceae bacterium]